MVGSPRMSRRRVSKLRYSSRSEPSPRRLRRWSRTGNSRTRHHHSASCKKCSGSPLATSRKNARLTSHARDNTRTSKKRVAVPAAAGDPPAGWRQTRTEAEATVQKRTTGNTARIQRAKLASACTKKSSRRAGRASVDDHGAYGRVGWSRRRRAAPWKAREVLRGDEAG